MKIHKQYFFYSCLLFWVTIFIVSCGKNVSSPDTSNLGNTIEGVHSGFKDTVNLNFENNIYIRYSKTSQCYPSNEIFAFSVSTNSFPSGTKFNWNFGDGKSATGATVRHLYDYEGYFTIILSALDNAGTELKKISFSIQAYGQQVTPTASFYAQIYDINYLNNYTFTSQSFVPKGSLVSLKWDWADGTQDSTANAQIFHNFPQVAADKTYPVKLIATAKSGCKDTAKVNVTVPAVYSITGDFDAVSYDVCTNEYFIFTPNIKGAPANCTFRWDFKDDSGLQTGAPFKKSFTYQNEYNVIMYVYQNGKLIYQTAKKVSAVGQNIRPKALMLKNVVSSDANSVTWAFYSQSNIPHGYFTGYYWDLGDGKIDDNFNTYVEKNFIKGTSAVNKTVKLIVTGNSGCKDTAIANIIIPAK